MKLWKRQKKIRISCCKLLCLHHDIFLVSFSASLSLGYSGHQNRSNGHLGQCLCCVGRSYNSAHHCFQHIVLTYRLGYHVHNPGCLGLLSMIQNMGNGGLLVCNNTPDCPCTMLLCLFLLSVLHTCSCLASVNHWMFHKCSWTNCRGYKCPRTYTYWNNHRVTI